MKIAILTQPLRANYGGLLQNYALQQILIRAGYNVETIDWWESNNLHSKLSKVKWYILSSLFPSKYKVNYQPNQNELSIICKNTNNFISKHIKRTDIVRSKNGFTKLAQKKGYDAYIVGSDQCWRPCYNTFLTSMFLDFTMKMQVKRIAYAASFGTNEWEFSNEQTKTCGNLAKQFDLITVREDSGVSLCKSYFDIDAIHVLDPTMLLKKEDYLDLVKEEPESYGKLFTYILDPDVKKKEFIQHVSNAINLKIFQVLPKYQAETRTKEDIKKHIEDCIFPNVTTWLKAFVDAEMTIVDSFHGMVFSIIFNKPFWVIGNSSRGMSRFSSLLKLFNLEDRLIELDKLDNINIQSPIDWIYVNSILENKRKICIDLLLNNLKE